RWRSVAWHTKVWVGRWLGDSDGGKRVAGFRHVGMEIRGTAASNLHELRKRFFGARFLNAGLAGPPMRMGTGGNQRGIHGISPFACHSHAFSCDKRKAR